MCRSTAFHASIWLPTAREGSLRAPPSENLARVALVERVESLTTFGSPHHGVGFGYGRSAAEIYKCGGDYGISFDAVDCLNAASELSVKAMRGYNYNYCFRTSWNEWINCRRAFTPPDPEQPIGYGGSNAIRYNTYIGEKYETIVEKFGQTVTVPVGDPVGTRRQATLPWRADDQPFPDEGTVDGIFTCEQSADGCHTELIRRSDTLCRAIVDAKPDIQLPSIEATIDGQVVTLPACNGSLVSVAEVRPQITTDVVEAEQEVYVEEGELIADSVNNLAVPLEEDSITEIRLWTLEEPVALELRDPSGTLVDPASDPRYAYSSSYTEEYGWQGSFYLGVVDVGAWTISVRVDEPMPYVLSVRMQTTTTLEMIAAPFTVEPEENVLIEVALLEDGTEVAGSNYLLTALQPDLSEVTLALVDDGTNGDRAVGDNVYSGRYSSDQIGFHRLFATATTAAGNERIVGDMIVVAEQTATLQSVSGERTPDLDANGLYDALELDVVIDVEQEGDFEITGTLVGPSGEVLTSSTGSSSVDFGAPLPIGQHTLTLSFDGRSLRAGM